MKKFALASILLILSLASCTKTDDANSLDSELMTSVSVYNGIADAQNMYVFVDGVQLAIGNISPVLVGSMQDYVTQLPGERRFSTRVSMRSGREFTSKDFMLTLQSTQAYSVFFYGHDANDLQVKSVEDEVIAPSVGKYKIRFANFRLENPSVKFRLRSGQNQVEHELKFGEVSKYLEMDVADFDLFVQNMNGAYANREFRTRVQPDGQSIYTIWAWGSIQSENNGIVNAEMPVSISHFGRSGATKNLVWR